MLEFRRVLCNKKTLILVIILLILHGVFFVFQCNDAKAVTLTGEELEEYIRGYGDDIQQVLENANDMLDNPLFRNSESFVYKNLIKTQKDFNVLSYITPVYGENRGIMTILNFSLSGFVLLLCGIFIVMKFMIERQTGLYLLVRCTEKGRARLVLQRIGILVVGIFMTAVSLYGSIYIISMIIFPGIDMLRPVQSVPELGYVISNDTLMLYFVKFVLRKTFGCIVVCLLMYFCMSMLKSSLCVGLFLVLMVTEYFLYMFIIPTDRLCNFRFLNLYTYLFCTADYSHYYNLHLFGQCISVMMLADMIVCVMGGLLCTCCIVQYSRQYPKTEGLDIKLFERLKQFISRHKPTHTLFMWEVKKVLFSQKGLLIFLAIFYLTWSASQESAYYDFRSKYVSHWYEEFNGLIDNKLVSDISNRKDKLEKKLAKLEDSIADQNEKLREFSTKGLETGDILKTITKLQKAIYEYQNEIKGISVVLEQAQKDLEYHEQTGMPIHLMDTFAYDLLLKEDHKTLMRNYLYTLLAVILVLSGIEACERSSHMEMTLHTVYYGRKRLLARKIVLMLLISIIITLSIHSIQFMQIRSTFGYNNLECMAQSIECARIISIPMTIKMYLIMTGLFRVLVSVVMGSLVMAISYTTKSRINTIAVSVFMLIIPMWLLAIRVKG